MSSINQRFSCQINQDMIVIHFLENAVSYKNASILSNELRLLFLTITMQKVILDFNKVQNIDTRGIAFLLNVFTKIRKRNFQVAIINLQPPVSYVVKVTQLSKFYPICKTLDDAIDLLAQPIKELTLEEEFLLRRLTQKYSEGSVWDRLSYGRKKYTWLLFIRFLKLLKRLFDFTLAFIALIVGLPIFLLIALAIKLDDGGPIFYISYRVGKSGRLFWFPKFRSMASYADMIKHHLSDNNVHDEGKTFKIKNDPRISRVGGILRRTSLDELPQLLCVLIGTMSLVGPRPPIPEEVQKYSIIDRKRLMIKPGLTGLWQVGGRADLPFSKQLQLDLEYIESQSFWLDIKILFRTIPAVLFGRGAY